MHCNKKVIQRLKSRFHLSRVAVCCSADKLASTSRSACSVLLRSIPPNVSLRIMNSFSSFQVGIITFHSFSCSICFEMQLGRGYSVKLTTFKIYTKTATGEYVTSYDNHNSKKVSFFLNLMAATRLTNVLGCGHQRFSGTEQKQLEEHQLCYLATGQKHERRSFSEVKTPICKKTKNKNVSTNSGIISEYYSSI